MLKKPRKTRVFGENLRFASSNWEALRPLKTMCLDKLNFWKIKQYPPWNKHQIWPLKMVIRLFFKTIRRPFGGKFGPVFQGPFWLGTRVLPAFPCQKIHGRLELLNGPEIPTTWGRKKLLPWTRWKMPKVPTMRLSKAVCEVIGLVEDLKKQGSLPYLKLT